MRASASAALASARLPAVMIRRSTPVGQVAQQQKWQNRTCRPAKGRAACHACIRAAAQRQYGLPASNARCNTASRSGLWYCLSLYRPSNIVSNRLAPISAGQEAKTGGPGESASGAAISELLAVPIRGHGFPPDHAPPASPHSSRNTAGLGGRTAKRQQSDTAAAERVLPPLQVAASPAARPAPQRAPRDSRRTIDHTYVFLHPCCRHAIRCAPGRRAPPGKRWCCRCEAARDHLSPREAWCPAHLCRAGVQSAASEHAGR